MVFALSNDIIDAIFMTLFSRFILNLATDNFVVIITSSPSSSRFKQEKKLRYYRRNFIDSTPSN